MRSWGSLLIGAIGLAVLDGIVSRPGATGRVGSWLSGAGSLVNRFLNPTIPFFSTPSSSATTSAQAGGTPTASTANATSAAPSAPALMFTTPPLPVPAGTGPARSA